MSLRKLRVLVEALPADSATARAHTGHDWRAAEYALADTRDLLDLLLTAFLNVNRDEKTAPMPWPKPSWRPGDPVPGADEGDAEEKKAKAKAAYEHILKQAKG